MIDIIEKLKKNPLVLLYIRESDKYLDGIGYTEHGIRHAEIVAKRAMEILNKLEYSQKECELAAIAGFLHDIGNVLGREYHGQSGALIAKDILKDMGYEIKDIIVVMNAIGNHEEEEVDPTNPVSAALIIADKSDVHRSRVRTTKFIDFDIHDRVNYAVESSILKIDKDKKEISLELNINQEISNVLEYFEIFLSRMLLCRKAAKFLKCDFSLFINKMKML